MFVAILAGSTVVGLEALGVISFGVWGAVVPGILLSLILFVGLSLIFPDGKRQSATIVKFLAKSKKK